jgi:hypothetical protein
VKLVHDDPEFDGLLRIVADKRKLAVALVEKDYWVTHTLWALQRSGLDIWFKGGTSLSKAFSLIERFSEDLDLKIEPGGVAALPTVHNWKREGAKAVAARKAFFEKLADTVKVPGTRMQIDRVTTEKAWRSANVQVLYPGKHVRSLTSVVRPFVLLEIGNARVAPFVLRGTSSFVHDELEHLGQLKDFEHNRPTDLRCVHPLVTLIEKLDALQKRVPRDDVEPASFVRHFEDAAHIIGAITTLPTLEEYSDVPALADEMLAEKQLAALPSARHAAFSLGATARADAIREAHVEIAPMFFGERISVDDACTAIRDWIAATF